LEFLNDEVLEKHFFLLNMALNLAGIMMAMVQQHIDFSVGQSANIKKAGLLLALPI
jgi:hypothetical protein